MRTVHTPEQVARWTVADLRALVGRYVVVEVPASDGYRDHMAALGQPEPAGGWMEGAAGIVVGASIETSALTDAPIAHITYDWGQRWVWDHRWGARVSVCDEHGDHYNEAGKTCLATLGVRGGMT